MYSSVVSGTVDLHLIDDMISRWKVASEELRKAPGYKSGYLLIDRHNGKAFVFSIWETEKNATDFETSGEYAHLTKDFVSLLTSQPVREVCEVSASVHNP